MNNRKNQRGFTLGEVLCAIIIGSIIFGAVALVISNAIETSRVSNQQENLSYLRMNIHESTATSTASPRFPMMSFWQPTPFLREWSSTTPSSTAGTAT